MSYNLTITGNVENLTENLIENIYGVFIAPPCLSKVIAVCRKKRWWPFITWNDLGNMKLWIEGYWSQYPDSRCQVYLYPMFECFEWFSSKNAPFNFLPLTYHQGCARLTTNCRSTHHSTSESLDSTLTQTKNLFFPWLNSWLKWFNENMSRHKFDSKVTFQRMSRLNLTQMLYYTCSESTKNWLKCM